MSLVHFKQDFADSATIFADSAICVCVFPLGFHPSRNRLVHHALESITERAVTVEPTLVGQLLGRNGLIGINDLAIQTYEMSNAKTVDVGVVVQSLSGEVLAEIGTVSANSLGQLLKGEVVLQVKLCVHTALFQQSFNLGEVDIERNLTPNPSPSGEGSR